MKKLILVCAFVLSACASFAASVTFNYSIDTTSISGQAGYLDFQFNPGPGTSLLSTLTVEDFDGGGGVLDLSMLFLQGDVSGDLPGIVTFTNSGAGVNEYSPDFVFGDWITFLLRLQWEDGQTGVDSPVSFYFSMLDPSFAGLLTTAEAPFTHAFQWDLNADASTSITNLSAPEPGMLLPVGLGMLALGWLRGRRVRRPSL